MLPACRISPEGPRMYRPDHDCADLRATSVTITKSIAIVIPHQAGWPAPADSRARQRRLGQPRFTSQYLATQSVEDAQMSNREIPAIRNFIAHRWTGWPCYGRPMDRGEGLTPAGVLTDHPQLVLSRTSSSYVRFNSHQQHPLEPGR